MKRKQVIEVLKSVPDQWILRTPETHYDSGMVWVRKLRKLGLLKGNILDFGCGWGRISIHLLKNTLYPEFEQYVGIDIQEEAIEFLKEDFPYLYPKFLFYHVPIKNSFYNPQGTIPPEDFPKHLPIKYGMTDNLLCISVLTHIEKLEIAQIYMTMFYDLLVPGGKISISWFRSPPNVVSNDVHRTVFKESDIMNLIRLFKVLYTERGFSSSYHDQWWMVLQKPI